MTFLTSPCKICVSQSFQQFSTMYLSLVPNRNTWLQHPAWYFFFKIFIHVQQFRLWFGQASRTGAGRSWCATWCAIANRQSLGILIGWYHWLSRTQYTIETKMSQPWFQNAKILKFFRLHEHFPNPSQGNCTWKSSRTYKYYKISVDEVRFKKKCRKHVFFHFLAIKKCPWNLHLEISNLPRSTSRLHCWDTPFTNTSVRKSRQNSGHVPCSFHITPYSLTWQTCEKKIHKWLNPPPLWRFSHGLC